MFLHSPPRQLLWKSSHSSTSAGSHREEGGAWRHLPRPGTNGEASRGSAPCLGSLDPEGHHPLVKQHRWRGSLWKAAWLRLLPLLPLAAGLLPLPTWCPGDTQPLPAPLAWGGRTHCPYHG